MKSIKIKIKGLLFLLSVFAIGVIGASQVMAQGGFFGAIYDTDQTSVPVNENIHDSKTDVYLNGGPQNNNANGLPVGVYYFQVTNPSGSVLLSTDPAVCRQVEVKLVPVGDPDAKGQL